MDLDASFIGNKVSHFVRDIISVQKNSWIENQVKHKNHKWKVQNGDLVLFWEDIWHNDKPLKCRFPRLYQLSTLKFQVLRIMVDLWSCYNHEEELFWSRKLRPWELEELKILDSVITSIQLNSKEDSLI